MQTFFQLLLVLDTTASPSACWCFRWDGALRGRCRREMQWCVWPGCRSCLWEGKGCSLSWVYLEGRGLVKDIMKERNMFRTKEGFTRTVLRIITVLLSIWNAGMLEAHDYFWSTGRTGLNAASKNERKIVFERSAIASNWRTSFQKAVNGSDFTQLMASCFCSQNPLEETPFCRQETAHLHKSLVMSLSQQSLDPRLLKHQAAAMISEGWSFSCWKTKHLI